MTDQPSRDDSVVRAPTEGSPIAFFVMVLMMLGIALAPLLRAILK